MACCVEGCEREVRVPSRGMCYKHYKREWRKARKARPTRGCFVEGCGRPHEAKGYCTSHYDKWKTHGDPLAATRKDPSLVQERGGMLVVHLGGEAAAGAVALVSTEDRGTVEGRRWWMTAEGYVRGKIDGKQVLLSRLLLGLGHGDKDPRQVDHTNGDTLDNRRENLRVVTYEQNMQNKKPWGKSGQRNVYYDEKKGLYRVIVTFKGKRYSGGRHKKLEDAIEAAKELRAQLLTHHNEDRT